MKDAIIKAIGEFSRDKDFRTTLVIGTLILIGFVGLILSFKGCVEYKNCTEVCSNNNVSETAIKCLEHCDRR